MRAKKDIMDEPPVFDNKFDKFKYWFVNVYWFHYKVHTIVAVIAISMIGSAVYSMVTNKPPDLTVVVASEKGYDMDYAAQVYEELNELVSELTGKKDPFIDFLTLIIDNSYNGNTNAMILATRLGTGDSLLYIVDGYVIDNVIGGDEQFQNLEPYGYGDVRLIDVSDAPRVRRLSMGQKLYAGLVQRDEIDDKTLELSIAALRYFTSP